MQVVCGGRGAAAMRGREAVGLPMRLVDMCCGVRGAAVLAAGGLHGRGGDVCPVRRLCGRVV